MVTIQVECAKHVLDDAPVAQVGSLFSDTHRNGRLDRMGALPQTTLVVPCYNEAQRLRVDAFARAMDEFPTLRFVFVDDGSSDGTFEVLGGICASRGRQAEVLRLPANHGKAEAVRQGMLRAMSGSPEVLGYWDADLSTPVGEWTPMWRLLESTGAQIVLGARVKLLGRTIERKEVRHYLGRFFATAVSHALRLAVYDTQCGAKLFRMSGLTSRIFADPFLSRWIFDVEILARALRFSAEAAHDVEGPLVVEYPLQAWVDVDGSKLKWSDFVRAIADLARIAAYVRRG
jgi:dolichyl-phosphate beta-glucosyltransferase